MSATWPGRRTPVALLWRHDDGGRAAAGYTGTAGDCGARAVAIATGMSYRQVYDRINALAAAERPRGKTVRSSARNGVHMRTFRRLMDELGWVWTPTMSIGSGTTVHLAVGEIPMQGPVVVRVSKHFTAVLDGVVHDTGDPGRDGTRAVYGYWTLPPVY